MSVKRVIDILGSISGLLVLSPVLLAAMLLVKAEGGSIFFFQDRLGKDAKVFRIFKLRTMVPNAEAMLDAQGRPTGQRITRVGQVLRQTSIDELPQLLNILLGTMSIVGPRPILPEMYPYMTDHECDRFKVRPGVTGLAQVKGRNFLKWSRRFNYDVVYVHRQSFGFDLYILLLTLFVVVRRRGIAQEVNPGEVNDVSTRPAIRRPVS
jgi:lipopolysaccharide/colanic/teichoic acid biosynthesis glycosyltransferase